ncbi:MAG: hypothetical protein ACTSUE_06460, partial [Promethearchaeota archaeon]
MIVSAKNPIVHVESFSEIEKFFISYIRLERINEHHLSLKLNMPRSFVSRILEELEVKGAVSRGFNGDKLILTDDLRFNDIYGIDGYKDLSIKTGTQILFSREHFKEILNEIEKHYKNCLDFQILCYFNSALEVTKRIITLIKDRLIINYFEVFHQSDIDFLDFIEKLKYSGDSHDLSALIEICLDFFYKIIAFFNKERLFAESHNLRPQINNSLALFHQEEDIEEFEKLTSLIFQSLDGKKEVISKIKSILFLHFNKKMGPVIYFQKGDGIVDGVKKNIIKIMDIINNEPF